MESEYALLWVYNSYIMSIMRFIITKKKFYAIAIISFCAIMVYVIFSDKILGYLYFQKLKSTRISNEDRRILSQKLVDSKYGVHLCIQDFDIFGGGTNRSSTIVLIQSNFEYIGSKIESYAVVDINKGIGKEKAIEANYILWRRTFDLKHLIRMYDMVKLCEPQDDILIIEFGRNRLQSAFDINGFDDYEFLHLLDTPAEIPIHISKDDFIIYCKKYLMPLISELEI